MKRCRKCQQVKPLADYSQHPSCGDGYRPSCRECMNARRAELAEGGWKGNKTCRQCGSDFEGRVRMYCGQKCQMAARLQRQKDSGENRRAWIFKRYGLQAEAIDIVLTHQEGLCAICREQAAVDIDHNHETNKFRGMLCHQCNLGLGTFRDRPDLLDAAAFYLRDRGWAGMPSD